MVSAARGQQGFLRGFSREGKLPFSLSEKADPRMAGEKV
jgi:hypothetical protein